MVTNEHCFIRICLDKQRSFAAKPRDAFHSQSRTGTIAWSDFRLYRRTELPVTVLNEICFYSSLDFSKTL